MTWGNFLQISCNLDFLAPFFKKMDFSRTRKADQKCAEKQDKKSKRDMKRTVFVAFLEKTRSVDSSSIYVVDES